MVQLFTAIGMDTGYSSPYEDLHENCNAGMERHLHQPDAPYIVKSPAMCDYLKRILDSGEVVVDHAIVPMREIYAAAESRRDVERRTPSDFPGGVSGGLWPLTAPEAQETVLAEKFYNLMYVLTCHDVPHTLLHFPLMIRDPEYLFCKLRGVLPKGSRREFLDAHRTLARPEIIHDFRKPQP